MSIATVGDLREYLEQFEDDAPIMIAHQPNWPLAEVLADVRTAEGEDEEIECEEHPDYLVGHYDHEAGATCSWTPECEEPVDNTVWLVAGGHKWDASPYAPREVFG